VPSPKWFLLHEPHDVLTRSRIRLRAEAANPAFGISAKLGELFESALKAPGIDMKARDRRLA
jgi:hypothetical protein